MPTVLHVAKFIKKKSGRKTCSQSDLTKFLSSLLTTVSFCPQWGSCGGAGRRQSPDLQSHRRGCRHLHLRGRQWQRNHWSPGPNHLTRYSQQPTLSALFCRTKGSNWNAAFMEAENHNSATEFKSDFHSYKSAILRTRSWFYFFW